MAPGPFVFALAPTIVAATMLLQSVPSLPSAQTLLWVALAAVVPLAAAIACRRRRRVAAALALGAIAALVFALAGARAAERLADRLAPALEGRPM
ncbi:MAG TPA: hypothetical protein VEA81_12595, partial [Burkholderiaceae bacterium]|nr:hypothetical protein [Burkholderiaceae bacterium]